MRSSVAIRGGYCAVRACPDQRGSSGARLGAPAGPSTLGASMVQRHRLLTALLGCVAALLLAALLGAPAASAAPRLTACPDGDRDFRCGTLSVPLDHAAAPGASPRLRLRFAAQRRPRPGGRLLIALSGGPGQGSVDAASSFAASLEPALRRYRLVVLDQRGTGRSGALNCPNMQRPALARPVPAGGARSVRAAHRAPARVLLHGGHRARSRTPPRHLRRERGRADGHLLRHARRAAVRARLPAARGPAHPRLDRRARRPPGVLARHVQGAAARAARAVRRRPLPRR